ncbi:hypothetical protein WKG88_16360 [Pantoea agglomerans]|uniref:hypothetical protein n=1 Tax=Enterobacter agglomerans TaxID=549 RepID=UPI003C7E75E4
MNTSDSHSASLLIGQQNYDFSTLIVRPVAILLVQSPLKLEKKRSSDNAPEISRCRQKKIFRRAITGMAWIKRQEVAAGPLIIARRSALA